MLSGHMVEARQHRNAIQSNSIQTYNSSQINPNIAASRDGWYKQVTS